MKPTTSSKSALSHVAAASDPLGEDTPGAEPREAVSARVSKVQRFRVLDILGRVAQLRAEGRDVISLCVGEPGQGAPTAVRKRAADAVLDGTDLGYSPVEGIAPLREALAGHYKRWYDVDIDPSRFIVTAGSSGAFQLSFLTCFDVGDRVALARPGYAAYKNILKALGIDVVELDCGEEVRFQPTVEMLEEEHEKAPLSGVMVASPANPTGTMIDAEHMSELADWCDREGVRLISDEIYHGITFGDSVGTTAVECSEQAIVISSFSKYWGMTGWRLGWMIVPEELVEPIKALAGNLTLCAPVPSQFAAVEAFSESAYEEGAKAVEGFAAARQAVLDAVDELGWTGLAPADGAFYMYATITPVLGEFANAIDWCAALLEEEGVAVSPGSDFDSVHGDQAVRISLAAGHEAVVEALERIKRFQARHRA